MGFMAGYKPLVPTSGGGGGGYLKLTPGETRIRILTPEPVTGVVFWEEIFGKRKASRAHSLDEVPANAESPREFWLMVVWHYGERSLKLWELTAATIKTALLNTTKNEDWSDPTQYDIVIRREGTGREDTKYFLTPCPPKPLAAEVEGALSKVRINLLNTFEERPVITKAGELESDEIPTETITPSQVARLCAIAKDAGVDDNQRDAIVSMLGFKSKKSITPEKYDEVVNEIKEAGKAKGKGKK